MTKQTPKEDSWDAFLQLCSQMSYPESLIQFFSLFLTFEEKELMAARYLIIQALLEGTLTQREISEKYKVSIAQITRGSNALKAISPKFKQMLEKKLK